jgi:hypothetical protein
VSGRLVASQSRDRGPHRAIEFANDDFRLGCGKRITNSLFLIKNLFKSLIKSLIKK